MPGKDVGFSDGLVRYPCVFDTGFGFTFQTSGFVYSNMTDSVTSGFGNQYAAKPDVGNNGSSKYAVAYGQMNKIYKTASFNWIELYITNSTFAHNSMRDGDGFAKKFGGATGNDPDWFKVTIKGFKNGTLKSDSIDFYLADFRFPANAQDFIVRDWRKVDLRKLGDADSLQFMLSSSDNGSFGMNTPAYFCLDDVRLAATGVKEEMFSSVASLFPNPVSDFMNLEIRQGNFQEALVMDVTGRLISRIPVAPGRTVLGTGSLPPGQYLLKLSGNEGTATTKFIKQ
jgi:hypothetical protein